MGFKDKMTKYYSDAYMEKYGDRMTSVAGTILSVKTEVKSILGIFNKLHVFLVVKPEVGKQVVKCEYKNIMHRGGRVYEKTSELFVSGGSFCEHAIFKWMRRWRRHNKV